MKFYFKTSTQKRSYKPLRLHGQKSNIFKLKYCILKFPDYFKLYAQISTKNTPNQGSWWANWQDGLNKSRNLCLSGNNVHGCNVIPKSSCKSLVLDQTDFISRGYDARRVTPCHPIRIVTELFLDQHRYSHLTLAHRKVVLGCCVKLPIKGSVNSHSVLSMGFYTTN